MTSVGVSETRLPSSSSSSPPALLDAGAFAPGTMLAGRYRIVALVGRGGMGEVYRAEDLRLAQTVALKFLPAELEHDPAARERLVAEVRNARTVSHPNVCRVYDVGEVQGRWFLTMEYIDGEDLASLLRRIGRLPPDKALEVGRQLCAGLAAAHDRGLLHRDLKPANVMIDGRGQARVTDFGLAIEAGQAISPTDVSGTLAYLAPERFHGIAASIQSDLYALGLILYEAFTGRPAFKASTIGDWQRVHDDSTPTSPSALVSEIDPAVERAIARCLEKDPARRPVSAAQVAASLPGGDPLAAAVAAGETPSPALVAASGEEGTLPRAHAWRQLGLCAAGFAAMTFFWPFWSLAARLALPHPELQRERARQVLQTLGYAGSSPDEAWWFRQNSEYLQHYRDAADRGRALDAALADDAALLFCYRRSPSALITHAGPVSQEQPGATVPGDTYLELGTSGRLLQLTVVSSPRDQAAAGRPAFDWSPLLAAAGLDPARLATTEPRRGSVYASDARAAWEGAFGRERVRAEAAAQHGRVTYFRAAPVWQADAADATPDVPQMAPGQQFAGWIGGLLLFGGLAFLAVLGAGNLRIGRGDRRGAYRLAVFVAALSLFGRIVMRHWTLAPLRPGPMGQTGWGEQIVATFGPSIFLGVGTWLAYLGFEPYVRRRWPHLLIASTRLLDGRWRDPLVGRSLLAALLGAMWMIVAAQATHLLCRLAGWGVVIPGASGTTPYDLRLYIGAMTGMSAVYLFFAIVYLAVLLLARLVLRSNAGAWLGLLAVFFVMYGGWGRVTYGPDPVLMVADGLALAATSVFLLWRSGLLALGVWIVVVLVLRDTPWTFALTAWYAWPTWISTAFIAALAVWGFKNVLGRQSAFPQGSWDG